MKKILMINGSLREKSLNKQLSELAAELLKEQAEVAWLDYSGVPFMNTDIEFPAPKAVQQARDEVAKSDGIWLFFPEYNSSYPGALKNLLDWLSRPIAPGASRRTAVSSGKPVTYSSVTGSSGGAMAHEKMYDLLKKIHMEIMAEHTLGIGSPNVDDGKLRLTQTEKEKLKAQADAFLSFINTVHKNRTPIV